MPLENSVAIAGLLSVLCVSEAIATADIHSGNFWLTECSANTQMCGSYISGMRDMNSMSQAYGRRAMFCPPVSATMGQLNQVIVAYMTKNPQQLSQPFILLATTALANAFPCPN